MTDDAGDETPVTPDEAGDGDADAPLSDLAGRRRERREERESADANANADDPFSTLGAEADASATAHASTDESDDAFEEMDVDPVDSEDVWSDLLADEADETVGPAGADDSKPDDPGTVAAVEEQTAAVGAEVGDAGESNPAAVDADEATEGSDPREEHVIPKADYCQRCAYFSDPPEVACGNEGTDIVSVEDFEHFRVRGCPVVENEFQPGDSNY